MISIMNCLNAELERSRWGMAWYTVLRDWFCAQLAASSIVNLTCYHVQLEGSQPPKSLQL